MAENPAHNILSDLEALAVQISKVCDRAGEPKAKERIHVLLERVRIRAEYQSKIKYGRSENLKAELGKKYNYSPGTIHQILHNRDRYR